MSTKRLEHLKEGEKIYLEVERTISNYDDDVGLEFSTKYDNIEVSDDDTFYTLEDLKQLTNDGMPKQGDSIQIRAVHQGTTSTWDDAVFICFFIGKPLVKFDDGTFDVFEEWRFLPKVKTELTLAEVEEKLGLEKGSLIIK